MQTQHQVFNKDAGDLSDLPADGIDLVVTSPPYPMIDMWDAQFAAADSAIKNSLARQDYDRSFELMHRLLDRTWLELYRVLRDGSFACINIGDAVRTVQGRFRLFANHARIQRKMFEIGFDVLPAILWRKQTNAPNKFMGSGMLPAGAYVTLEHEYILIFRKGGKRSFSTAAEKLNRMRSAIFWEERNIWYSDIWDIKGTRQRTGGRGSRDRSAAFPFLLPFRLINMYSVYGDTVLDPFLGTGTTALAAAACGRNSVGYEIEESFMHLIKSRVLAEASGLSNFNLQRITNHHKFLHTCRQEKRPLRYTNEFFGFPVMTRQETKLKLVFVNSVQASGSNRYIAGYWPDEHARKYGEEAIYAGSIEEAAEADHLE